MRNQSRFLLALLPLVVPIVSGCGGNDDNQNYNPGGNGTVETGTASLNKAFTGSGDRKTNLSDATKAFDDAYRRNNSDSRAALGYAVASSAGSAQTILDLFNQDARSRGTAKDTGLVKMFRRLTPLNSFTATLGTKDGVSLDTLLPFFATASKSRAYPTSPTPAQLRLTLATVSTSLGNVSARLTDANLNALEANPLVVSYMDGTTTKSVKLGSVEGYALRSALKTIRGFVEGALAYDFDGGTYDPSAAFEARFRTQLRANGTLTAATYLPGGNFGTLTATGGTRLKTFGSQWVSAADDGKVAIVKYRARTGTGWLTNESDEAPSATDLTNAETYLNTFKSYLTSAQIVPLTDDEGNQVNLTLNLPAWLDGTPPASLRGYFPSLRSEYLSDVESSILHPVPGSIADPTFGGLISNTGGVPAPALYGREYTLENGDTTGQGVVALWALAFPVRGN